MQVIESILADAAQIAAIRRDIHAHPELCFEEKRTSDVIAEQLADWGIPIHRGMGTTGDRRDPQERHQRRARSACAPTWTRCRSPSTTPSRTRAPPRQDARLRPRRPHRDAARGRQAPVEAPQLRRHRLPDLPAGRRRRRRRARDDASDGLFEKFPMEAVFGAHNWPGHGGRPVRAEERPGVRVEQRVQDRHPRQGLARGDAAQRHRPGAGRVRRWCRRSRPSSRATSGRSTPA